MPESTSFSAPTRIIDRLRFWGLGAFAVLTFALALRYGFIQSRVVGAVCLETGPPWWCGARDAISMVHAFSIWGALGLVGGALGFWYGWRWALRLGLVMSIMGLVVYNAELGAAGLLLTLFGLARA